MTERIIRVGRDHRTRCDSCGEISEDCYRCSECGRDLTDQTRTSGIEG